MFVVNKRNYSHTRLLFYVCVGVRGHETETLKKKIRKRALKQS